MEMESNIIISRDGLQLNAGRWIPGEEKAILCIVHGIGEHFKRYTGLAEYFCSKGFVVFSYDQRGHGNSEGKRGHSASYSLLLDDVENLMKWARSLYPDLPLILYGHSWGGNIVANFIIKRKTKEISGAIISSAWFELKVNVSPILLKIAKLINNFFPSFTQNNRIDPDLLSKDNEVVNAYIQDPLVHSKITVGTYMQAIRQGNWAINNAHKVKTPTLIIHGTDDKITSWEASKQFAENAGTFATFKSWNGVKHEPHHDLEKADVIKYIYLWINQNIPV
jgi:alpha-beta hydrolase superfamily lysophospholipase